MSGIIGGAGSKSGIIGYTEIDYEEGTFTATGRSGTSSVGYYTKTGNLIKFAINAWNITSTGGSAEMYITGLPFTPALAECAVSVGPTYQVDFPTNAVTLRAKVGLGAITVLFYWTTNDGNYIIATCSNFDSSSAGIQVSGTYMI